VLLLIGSTRRQPGGDVTRSFDALCDAVFLVNPQASLLCSLEKEQRGHLIAEGSCSDTLLQDVGTQTYNFLSAPFHRGARLAELAAAKPLELHLQLELEGVTSRHHKATSAFTFLCGHSFPRREYGQHFRWASICILYYYYY